MQLQLAAGAEQPLVVQLPSWILRLRDSVPASELRDAAELFAADYNLCVLGAVPSFERQFYLGRKVDDVHSSAAIASEAAEELRHPSDARTAIYRLNRPRFAPQKLHYHAHPAAAYDAHSHAHFGELCLETSGRPPLSPCPVSSSEATHNAVEWMEPMRGHRRLKRRTLLSHSEVAQVLENLKIHDPGFPDQWHLYNEIEPSSDINVTGVWKQGVTGKNVVVAIVDDGIDMKAKDLKDKIELSGSYDFNTKERLPLPQFPEDVHGTRCAGEVAAGRNSYCGVGVAFDSKVSGIRILSEDISPADEATAYTYQLQVNDIYSCSFGPDDSGKVMQGPPANVVEAFAKGVSEGRGGRGAIYVFASGNGGRNSDDCNADGYANSPYTFTIGAIDRHNKRPYYQENCAAQLAVTYSGGDDGAGIFTTDVGSNSCTSRHSGTSAAAPIAAGIFALIISEVPTLHWRTLMHLVVETAVPFNYENEDGKNWQKQPWSGRYFSHHFGFGKIDTFRLLEAARKRSNVGAVMVLDTPWEAVNINLDDASVNGTAVHEITIPEVPSLKTLEYVILTISIHNSVRSNLSIELVSPNNITSRMLKRRILDTEAKDIVDWSFSSVAHWGENATGNWTIRVNSISPPGERGSVNGMTLRLTGESISPPDAASEVLSGYNQASLRFIALFVIFVSALAACWAFKVPKRTLAVFRFIFSPSTWRKRPYAKTVNSTSDTEISPLGQDSETSNSEGNGAESSLLPHSVIRSRSPTPFVAPPPIWVNEARAEDA